MSKQDYYKILNIDKQATTDEIKKAYRKLALQWHPDKNKSPEAEKIFRDVGNAYQVLSDPVKRSEYDNCNKVGQMYNCEFIDPFSMFDQLHMIFEALNNVFAHGHNITTGSDFIFETVIITDNMPNKINYNKINHNKINQKKITKPKKQIEEKWKTKVYKNGTVQKIMSDSELNKVLNNSTKLLK